MMLLDALPFSLRVCSSDAQHKSLWLSSVLSSTDFLLFFGGFVAPAPYRR